MSKESLAFLNNNVCWYLVLSDRNQQRLFRVERDYEYYLRLLKKFKRSYQIHIFAFCLLPINIQLILQSNVAIQLPLFLENVNRSYQLFFNARYEPSPDIELYQQKRAFIDNDSSFFERIQYVENSPVGKHNPWSSASHRIESEGQILDKTIVFKN